MDQARPPQSQPPQKKFEPYASVPHSQAPQPSAPAQADSAAKEPEGGAEPVNLIELEEEAAEAVVELEPATPPAAAPAPKTESKSAPKHDPRLPTKSDAAALAEEPAAPFVSKIKAFGVADDHARSRTWKRQPKSTGNGAVRVRTFRGKLSDQGLGYLDDAVNDWLDGHPEVEVKFVTSTVGVFEGKIREPALILNLWY